MSCGDLFPVSGGERRAAAVDAKAALKLVRPEKRKVQSKQEGLSVHPDF